jgi:fatty acid desaturase
MNELFPIPVRINMLMITGCTLFYFTIMFAFSQSHLLIFKILFALAFAITMIPVYSLMHEAAHRTLHPNAAWNNFLGRWLCCMFIIPFTFFRHCHLKHHKKNRTDDEMWDLYYKHQNKWLRYGNLYAMMIGLGYLALWLSVILFAIAPALIYSPLFKKHKEIRGFLEGSDEIHKIRTEQLESISVIIFQILVLWLLNWDFSSWLILYLVHGFVWSSQNYVNHAFSPRHIIEGAHNLKMPGLIKIIYLNFNIHLIHHRHPQIPWIYLPRFLDSRKQRMSFYKNYLRLWKGPRLTEDPSPKPLKE